MKAGLRKAGIDFIDGDSAIVPVMLYDAKLSQVMAEELLKKGIYVIGFFFPVVPKDKARIRVQWDPERDIKNNRLEEKSIQVGITAALSEQYSKKWITKIEDCTNLTHQMRTLVYQGKYQEAEKLLPILSEYPVNEKIAKILGMD